MGFFKKDKPIEAETSIISKSKPQEQPEKQENAELTPEDIQAVNGARIELNKHTQIVELLTDIRNLLREINKKG